jgi:lactate dehydrogenase-like 2-hydroxyacid dehydrogenase
VERELNRLFDVRLNADDRPMSGAELTEALKTADALCPTVTDVVSAEVLEVAGLKTRLIGNFGVGFNHIDTESAARLDIAVTNTPDVLTHCTADLAMTLLLMTARRTGEGERELRAGRWNGWRPTHMMGSKVTGKTLGIIGFGRIGAALAHRAHHGFGMKILYHNTRPAPAERTSPVAADYRANLGQLLAEADFVSLHCPSNPSTRQLINAERLAQMKSSAFLINTARGDVVDETALANALANGLIAGAGLDVYANEPQVPEALATMDNVVALPHLGSATTETRTEMGMRVVDNLKAFFAGAEPPDRVV